MSIPAESGTAEQLVLVPRLLSSQRDLNPRPILRTKVWQVAAKGIRESDGVTESDRLTTRDHHVGPQGTANNRDQERAARPDRDVLTRNQLGFLRADQQVSKKPPFSQSFDYLFLAHPGTIALCLHVGLPSPDFPMFVAKGIEISNATMRASITHPAGPNAAMASSVRSLGF